MIITTDRLLLREFVEDDWRAVLAYQSDARYPNITSGPTGRPGRSGTSFGASSSGRANGLVSGTSWLLRYGPKGGS